MIDIWELWERDFKNAKKFFDCKGNVETKSKLKNKWHSEFNGMLRKVIEEVMGK